MRAVLQRAVKALGTGARTQRSRRRRIAMLSVMSFPMAGLTVLLSHAAQAAAPGQYTVSGTAVALSQPADALLGRAAPAADADVKGMFGPQVGWPVIPVHVALLPNGHLLSYGTPVATAQQGGLTYDDWNPAQGMVDFAHGQTASMDSYNSFCNALQTLPDGRVLMVGGNSTMSTMLYEPGTKAESMGPGLNRQRWYGSVLKLTDDRMLVLGGANYYNTGAYLTPNDNSGVATTPEIGDGTNPWTLLTGADSTTAFGAQDNRWWYPRAFNAPDGTVFGVSADQMWRLDPTGSGSVTPLGSIPASIGVSGAAVMYAPGKILLAGGGQQFNQDALTATSAATVLDISGTAPSVTPVAPMANRRNWLNLTVLPTGEVLANGGTVVGTQAGAANSDYTAELWNPDTQTWRSAATAQRTRTYHSTAVLMPSGAVFTGGGGVPGPEDNFNSEMYYPPYLFTKATDGSVHWASRPQLTSISGSLTWGGQLSLGTADARSIASVSLISAAAETHSVNTDQRRIPLTFSQSGSTLSATLPASRNVVPPGSYLLQAVDANGVPSASQIVTIRNGGAGSVTVYEPDQSGVNGIGGAGPAVSGSVPLTIGSTVGFESSNFPGRRVRHQTYGTRIDPISAASSPADRADSSFVVRAGLADPTGLSFESVNLPGYFLKVENGTVYLRQNDGTTGFAGNATFLAVTGLTGQNTSFAVYSNPTLFLRHQNYVLYAQPFNGSDLNRKDATFAVRTGLASRPGAPSAVAASAGDTSLAVSWTAPAGGPSPVTGYQVSAVPADGTLPTVTCTSATTSCSVTGLTNGSRYAVTVTASTEVGAGPASGAVTAIPFPAGVMTSTATSLWLDGADGATLFGSSTCSGPAAAGGSGIGCWKDKSGQGDNATQATTSRQATLSTLNGLSTPTLNGTGAWYQLNVAKLPTGTTPSAVYVVAVQEDPAPTKSCYRHVIAWGATGTANARIVDKGCNTAKAYLDTFNTWSAMAPTKTWPTGSAALFDGTVTGTKVTAAMNGASSYTYQGAAHTGSSAGAVLGGASWWGNTATWQGRIAEVIVLNTAPSAADNQAIEQYLARKWAVTLG